MASGVGKWEVVKKGKKQNASSGSGGKTQDKKPGRKALREANVSQNRKKTHQYSRNTLGWFLTGRTAVRSVYDQYFDTPANKCHRNIL